MLGAQRRIEARIGQLLGNPKPGERTDLSAMPERLVSFDDAQPSAFSPARASE
jgi:hypothetical protein